MEIQGLNERQTKIADLLWGMNSRTEVEAFIKGLQGDLKRDAQLVLDLMILAVLDEVTDTTDAAELIERIKNES